MQEGYFAKCEKKAIITVLFFFFHNFFILCNLKFLILNRLRNLKVMKIDKSLKNDPEKIALKLKKNPSCLNFKK